MDIRPVSIFTKCTNINIHIRHIDIYSYELVGRDSLNNWFVDPRIDSIFYDFTSAYIDTTKCIFWGGGGSGLYSFEYELIAETDASAYVTLSEVTEETSEITGFLK